MSDAVLLRTSELPDIMNMPPGACASVLMQAGLRPIDMGRGRGRGLLWLRDAVIETLHAMHTAAQEQTATNLPKARPTHPVTGKTFDQVKDEIRRRARLKAMPLQ